MEKIRRGKEKNPMHYKKLWTDLHSNIHHNQMGELDQWIEHAKNTVDFWPVAYYPFYM